MEFIFIVFSPHFCHSQMSLFYHFKRRSFCFILIFCSVRLKSNDAQWLSCICTSQIWWEYSQSEYTQLLKRNRAGTSMNVWLSTVHRFLQSWIYIEIHSNWIPYVEHKFDISAAMFQHPHVKITFSSWSSRLFSFAAISYKLLNYTRVISVCCYFQNKLNHLGIRMSNYLWIWAVCVLVLTTNIWGRIMIDDKPNFHFYIFGGVILW